MKGFKGYLQSKADAYKKHSDGLKELFQTYGHLTFKDVYNLPPELDVLLMKAEIAGTIDFYVDKKATVRFQQVARKLYKFDQAWFWDNSGFNGMCIDDKGKVFEW